MVLLEAYLGYQYLKHRKKNKGKRSIKKSYRYNPNTDKSLSGALAKKLSGR